MITETHLARTTFPSHFTSIYSRQRPPVGPHGPPGPTAAWRRADRAPEQGPGPRYAATGAI